MINQNEGQLSIELIMMAAILVFIIFSSAPIIGDMLELNEAMAAARSGATEGMSIDNIAFYSEETFQLYVQEKPRLLYPSSVRIVKIDYINQGYNSYYKKVKIQLHIYASAPNVNHPDDKNSLGDRINYYARKRITNIFKTENMTNTFYNPAFSPRYVFTTADVKWV